MNFLFNSRVFFSFEGSCDDTCISIYLGSFGVLRSIICSQHVAHKFYGGIVPVLAQSCHRIILLSGIRFLLLSLRVKNNLFFINYTKGPGLKYSLLSIVVLVRFMIIKLRISFFSINHLSGHIFSNFIGKEQKLIFPFISFVVSGGHTIFIIVLNVLFFFVLGRKVDDSVGEVFDKIARSLGFLYPGASFLEKEALCGSFFFLKKKYIFSGSNKVYFNISNSGFKTFFYLLSQYFFFTKRDTENISALFQRMISFLLCYSVDSFVGYTGINNIFFSGGVSMNIFFRKYIYLECNRRFFFPSSMFSLDNAPMIGIISYFKITSSY